MTFLIVLQGVQTSLVKISNLRELRILKKIEIDNCTAYQTLTSFFIQNLLGHVVDYLS